MLEFPQKAPKGAILQRDLSALDQLELWKTAKVNYTEHNPSVTIYVKGEEWIRVANWVYDNWEIVGGLSFLPASDHIYKLAPYEEITQEEYDLRAEKLKNFDLSKLTDFEKTDTTDRKQELACVGGQCEL